jgi:hypothetical protein
MQCMEILLRLGKDVMMFANPLFNRKLFLSADDARRVLKMNVLRQRWHIQGRTN